jgi:hypothetical protein
MQQKTIALHLKRYFRTARPHLAKMLGRGVR